MHNTIEKVFLNGTIKIHHDVTSVNVLKEGGSNQMKKIQSVVSDEAIKIINRVAKRKANKTCFGYLYEPIVPKKLKNEITIKGRKDE